MKELEPGRQVWISCEVKPGPFSNERLVRISSELGEWVGFVEITALKDPVSEGRSFVRGTVVDVVHDALLLQLPGVAFASSVFRWPKARAQDLGSVST